MYWERRKFEEHQEHFEENPEKVPKNLLVLEISDFKDEDDGEKHYNIMRSLEKDMGYGDFDGVLGFKVIRIKLARV